MKMSLLKRLVALTLLPFALLNLTAFTAQAEPVFTFTAIPDEDESRLNERFGKVADYLTEQLGVTVKYIPVKSYPAAIVAFRNDQVQLAWFGGLSGVQARHLVPGSTAIAQGYEDQFFKTYIIANASSHLPPLDDYLLILIGGGPAPTAELKANGYCVLPPNTPLKHCLSELATVGN